VDKESILKLQALQNKKQKLYEELVDLELKDRNKENILNVKNKSLIEVKNKINSVNIMISEIAHGKIEKVQENFSIQK